MGSKAEVEKKEAELVQELTAPTELCAGKRRPQDSTAQKEPPQKEPPHKKRRKGMCYIICYSNLLACTCTYGSRVHAHGYTGIIYKQRRIKYRYQRNLQRRKQNQRSQEAS
jgi:hypothetical protein